MPEGRAVQLTRFGSALSKPEELARREPFSASAVQGAKKVCQKDQESVTANNHIFQCRLSHILNAMEITKPRQLCDQFWRPMVTISQ